MMRNLAILGLVGALAIGLAPTAWAVPVVQEGPKRVPQMSFRDERIQDAIDRMERRLGLASDGTIVLTVESGRQIGVPEELFSELSRSLERTNQLIRAGRLDGAVLLADGFVDVRVSTPSPVEAISSGEGLASHARCRGVSAFRYRWWGYQQLFDSCDTQLLISLLGGGASVATICASLGVTSVGCGVVAGVLGVSAAYVAAVASRGNGGIVMNRTWTYIWWLSPQY